MDHEPSRLSWFAFCGVYLVRQGNTCKIGHADNVGRRITAHGENANAARRGLIGAIICSSKTAAKSLERDLLKQFRPLCIRGREWHRYDDAIRKRFVADPNFISARTEEVS